MCFKKLHLFDTDKQNFAKLIDMEKIDNICPSNGTFCNATAIFLITIFPINFNICN